VLSTHAGYVADTISGVKEVNNVRLGCNFSNNCTSSSRIWIRRHRRGVGGNRESFILSVPGDVRHLFHFRLERQRSPMISNRLGGVVVGWFSHG
jgi:hypothetical protein